MSRSVVVVGTGIVGSAIAAHLTTQGYDVSTVEQFAPGHQRGSSHGDSRLFRRIPFEGDLYTRLAGQALKGWRAWNQAAGTELLHVTGGLDMSVPGGNIAGDSRRYAREQSVPHEVITGAEVNARYPIYNVPSDWLTCFQSSSGVIYPDRTLAYLRETATRHGGEFHWNTPVYAMNEHPNGVDVETSKGRISADYAIIASGAWLCHLLPDADIPARTIRNVLCWFTPSHPAFETMPIFLAETGTHTFYGMPTSDGRLKVAIHGHFGELTDPEHETSPVMAADTDPISEFVETHFSDVAPEPVETVTCLYTELPETEFLIDFAPSRNRILVFSPCSGHGFKYAPTFGDMAKAMIETGKAPFPEQFSFDALASRQRADRQ
ncbi:MAG: N-methyl-L-tryptophan oxidase [Proteobacteria bacterium]|nr:N-methyl-L-tryptophan oxidase [Pseudomonadota bacterium]